WFSRQEKVGQGKAAAGFDLVVDSYRIAVGMSCSCRVLADAERHTDQIGCSEPDIIAHGEVTSCFAVRRGGSWSRCVFLEFCDSFSRQSFGFSIKAGDSRCPSSGYLRVVDVDFVLGFLAVLLD